MFSKRHIVYSATLFTVLFLKSALAKNEDAVKVNSSPDGSLRGSGYRDLNQIVMTNGTMMIISLYEGPPLEMKVDDTDAMKSRSKMATFDGNVTFPDSDKDDHRFLETLSPDEYNNIRWIQEVRLAKNLQKLLYSTELILEAQRWSKYLASVRRLEQRNPITTNLDSNWRKLAENVVQNPSVARSGAYTALMNSLTASNRILDPVMNRIGLGITKAATGQYYMVQIFGQL